MKNLLSKGLFLFLFLMAATAAQAKDKVNKVSLDSDASQNNSFISAYIDQIKNDEVLNLANLERYLLLINDLPGVSATADLKQTPDGNYDMALTTDYRKFSGSVSYDNAGTTSVGRDVMRFGVQANSFFGLSETLKLSVFADRHVNELKYGQIEYIQPVGSQGTKMNFSYSENETNPGASFNFFGVEGDTTKITAGISHPFIRSIRQNLTGRFGFSLSNEGAKTNVATSYDDSIRTASLGINYDKTDSLGGTTFADASVTQGFAVLGATNQNSLKSRANGDATFRKYNLEISRNQKITDKVNLELAATGQYADQALLASEEFGYGGRDYGRGYESLALRGDTGVAGKIELQYSVDDLFFNSALNVISLAQVYSFYDIGKIWQKETPLPDEQNAASRSSAGIGMRFELLKSVQIYTEYAEPLVRTSTTPNDGGKFNFGFSYQF